MLYNVRKKIFPDGHCQYIWSENPIFRVDENIDPPALVEAVKRRNHFKKLRRLIRQFDHSEDSLEVDEEYSRFRNNISRSVNEVYDLARSNHFDWFITLTFNPQKVNSFEYEECAEVIKRFTDRLRKLGCKWIIIPEQHKSGAYHFHGLVQGKLPLTDSGKKCYDKETGESKPVYNLTNYEYGFTDVTAIGNSAKTASYITKYLTKHIEVPKGKKCYWASRSLDRPKIEYLLDEDGDWIFGLPPGLAPRWSKQIETEYGRYVISEE